MQINSFVSPQGAVKPLNVDSAKFSSAQVQAPALQNDAFVKSSDLKFSGKINEKYSVTLRWSDGLDADVASAVLRKLQVQEALLEKAGDDSNLQLNLDALENTGYPLIEEAALAETFQLLHRPVDVLVKSISTGVGVKTLQTATGNRLMNDRAELNFETTVFPHGRTRTSDALMTNELNEEYSRELEQVLMSRAGVSRKQAHELLNSGQSFNPLQALNYGRNGLVDGVLVGYDQVVTRKNLKDYLKDNKENLNTKEAVEAFLYFPQNIHKLPTTPLADFSSKTAGVSSTEPKTKRPGLYQSVKAMIQQAEEEKMEAIMEAQQEAHAEEEKMEAIMEAQQEAHAEEVQAMRDDAHDSVVEYLMNWANETGTLEDADALLDKMELQDALNAQVKEEADEPLMMYRVSEDGSSVAKIPGDKLPLSMDVKAGQIRAGRFELDNLPKDRSLLLDDTIYFNDAFDDETAEQITDALLMLDEKKAAQNDPSHIKIVVNSPGGVVWAAMDINSTIRSLRTPVDLVVKGFAASSGSILLSGVTGNRFITPGAKVMLHEASAGLGRGNGIEDRSFTEEMHKITQSVVRTIAERAGRPFDKAMKEMQKDVWLNPIESLFYGENGLVDGVVVGDKVVTKAQVYDYMLKQHNGDKNAVDQLIEDRIESLGSPRLAPDYNKHDENNPFDNAYKVIMTLAKTAPAMKEVSEFSGSVPRDNKETIEQVVVKTSPDILKLLGLAQKEKPDVN